MATIAEIREKYPQYADMPDAALADALHSKFYSDIPKTDFYTKVGLSQSKEVPSATPTYSDAIPEARKPDRGILDYVVGIPETAMALGTGAIRGAVAPFAAVAGELAGGVNTPEGRAQGARWGGNVEKALTYTPQTQTSKDILDYAGEKLQGVDLNAIPFAQGSVAAAMAPAATRQAVGAVKNEAGYLKNAVSEIPMVKKAAEDKAAANLATSYERAPQIEAAQLAPKYGITLNPEQSNPSAGAKVRGALVGDTNINNRMAIENEPVWTAQAKKGLGIGEQQKLDVKAFDEARAQPDISRPYEEVRKIPEITVRPDTIGKLDEVKVTPLFGDKGEAAATNAYIDNLKTQLQTGGDGSKLLKSIQQLRQEAQGVYRTEKAGNPVSPAARMEADAKMSAAKVMEEMIDDSLPNIRARDAWIKARTKMAQSYDVEAATDFATGKVNPQVLAKMASEGKPLSGFVGDLAKIAANFPEIASVGGKEGLSIPRLSRATVPGMIGAVAGLPFGPLGSMAGMSIGAGVGEIGKRIIAKNMLSPGYQAKHAIPTDYRPQVPVNNLRPVAPGQSNIVPFNPVNALVEPEIRPNFVFGQPNQYVEPVLAKGPAQLPAPSAQSTLASVASEEARRTRMAKMAEAEATANQPASAPTRGGTVYELDPVSGKLVPASQGIKGATPETFQDYTATLRSATDKLSSGQRFALDAAEKVAWDKTRVDLAEISADFKRLSDKDIAAKMMDRQWVEDAVAKAQQKAKMFDELAQRAQSSELMGARAESAKNAEALRQAIENQGRMATTMEMLQDRLSDLRAKEGARVKLQGPKTRAAKRNALSPENRNNLREE